MLLTTRIKRLVILCGSAAVLSILPAPVVAQTTTQAKPLTQGSLDLSRALRAIGRHFGVPVTFDNIDLAGSQGRPVRDAATAYDAVVQATDGTGLSYELVADGGVRVFRRENSGGDIVVVATRDEAETNLNVNSAATSTRTGKSLREQPRATAVVGAKLIADQQVQSIQEALRNVSGTTASGGTQGVPAFTVRGFTADALTNGLSSTSGGAQPVAGLERIEVLKGPDVVLAGANNLGGIVNVVTKRPVANPLLDVALEYGSFDDKKITVDASNALSDARTVSARFVGEVASADRTYQGYEGRREYLIAPSLRYKTADSDFVIGVSASDVFSPKPSATIIDLTSTDRQVIRPFRRIPYGPNYQGVRLGVTREYFDFSQKVTDWLTLVARGEHAFTTQSLQVYLPGFAGQPAVTDTFVFFPTVQETRTSSNAIDAYARLNFATGPVRHTVTAGFNYSRRTDRDLEVGADASNPLYEFDLATGAATDFSTGEPVARFPPMPRGTNTFFTSPTRQSGFYIQDFVELGRLKLLGALRVNKYRTGISYADPAFAEFNSDDRFSATLPSFGAVYDITRTLSVYANYQQGYEPGTFNPNQNSTVPGAFTGPLFPDVKTRNIEGGLKLDLFNRRLAIVAAYYRNRQTNLVDTASVPGTSFLAPGQQGRGVELDVTGRILPGWNVVASFSHTKFSQLERIPEFQEVVGQPETKYSFFTSYEPVSGRLKGLGISAGMYGASRSFIYGGTISPQDGEGAFNDGTIAEPGTFARFRPFSPANRQVDASLYYTFGIARLTFGVKNLFDRVNYGTTRTVNFIPVSDPRTYRATLSFRFY